MDVLRLVVACAFAFAITLTSALAATVQPKGGRVLINEGKGFRPLVRSKPVAVGNMVMVDPNGSADIVYDDGCRIRVSPGEVHTISRESPCKAVTAPITYMIGIVTGFGIGGVILDSGPKRPASP